MIFRPMIFLSRSFFRVLVWQPRDLFTHSIYKQAFLRMCRIGVISAERPQFFSAAMKLRNKAPFCAKVFTLRWNGPGSMIPVDFGLEAGVPFPLASRAVWPSPP
jgi:hypothetical protein